MAKAIVCDICGKVVQEGSGMHNFHKIKVATNIKEFDTCPDCSDKIKNYVFKLMEENEDDNA